MTALTYCCTFLCDSRSAVVSSCLSNRQKKGGIDLNWQDRRVKFEICVSAMPIYIVVVSINYFFYKTWLRFVCLKLHCKMADTKFLKVIYKICRKKIADGQILSSEYLVTLLFYILRYFLSRLLVDCQISPQNIACSRHT